MTTYTVCIDPGFVEEAFGVVVFREDEGEKEKPIIFGKGFSLVEGTLERAKRNDNFHFLVALTVSTILDRVQEAIEKDDSGDNTPYIDIIIEHQMAEKTHGHDLTWLSGLVAGIATSKDWNVLKLKRNMDCCKRLGIPVSKKVISREMKKRKTLRKVWDLGYTELKTPHLADAAILYLSH